MNAEKTKYMLMSCHQNAKENHSITMASFGNVAKLKCLGITVTNQNLIQEEIQSRLNMGNASYHSIQEFCLLVSCLETSKLKYTKL
jgi:hypothetical protein